MERFVRAWSREDRARDPRLLREAHDLILALASQGRLPDEDASAGRVLRSHLRPLLVFHPGLARRFEELWSIHVGEVSPPATQRSGPLRETPPKRVKPQGKSWLPQSLLILVSLAALVDLAWLVSSQLPWQEPVNFELPPPSSSSSPPATPVADLAESGPPFKADFTLRREELPLVAPFIEPISWWREIAYSLAWGDWLWLAGGASALALTFLVFWFRAGIWRESQYLLRQLGQKDPQETSRDFFLGLQSGAIDQRAFVSGVAARFRQHQRQASSRLDGRRTVAASIRQGGFFTPVRAVRPETPEYIFLLEERHEQDHLGRLAQSWAAALKDVGVTVAEYRFHQTPERPYPAPLPGEDADPTHRVCLRDLAVRFPRRRLILFGQNLPPRDRFTGEPESWFVTLGLWEGARALLAPTSSCDSEETDRWREAGWTVFDFSESGVRALGNWMAGEGGPVLLPEELLLPPDLIYAWKDWLGPVPVGARRIDRLEADLTRWLGDDGLLLLRACAVFPVIDWHLTRFLQYAIRSLSLPTQSDQRARDQERMHFTLEEQLLRLSQLPWLREAWMPEWLREHLLAGLGRKEQNLVTGLVHSALEAGAAAGGSECDVKVSASNPRKLRRLARSVWEKLARRYPELEDELVLANLSGSHKHTMFRLPKALASTMRWSWPLVLAAAGAAAVVLGARRWDPASRDTELPPGLSCPLVQRDPAGSEWAWVPPGSFGRQRDGKWERVTLDQGFWMATGMGIGGTQVSERPASVASPGDVHSARSTPVGENLILPRQHELSTATEEEWALAYYAGTRTGTGGVVVGLALPEKFEEGRLVIVPTSRLFEIFPGVRVPFRWCPAGTFTMGRLETEKGGNSDETPHQVTFEQGFWMAETETTQAVWQAVMEESHSDFFKSGPQAPVGHVRWEDVQTFVGKVNLALPQGAAPFRLPTDAEWEYACRAGTAGDYNVADAALEELGWYDNNSGGRTHPVALKKPNAWGLYDMHGNVWEWVQDRYGDYPRGSATGSQGSTSKGERAMRGGSWVDSAASTRSWVKIRNGSLIRLNRVGFRLARSYTSEPGDEAVVRRGRVTQSRSEPEENRGASSPLPVTAVPGTEHALPLWGRICLNLCYVPPGAFAMGEGRDMHQVTLTKGFWMAKTETTQFQWRAIMGSNPSRFSTVGPDAPVENVNWEEASNYAARVTDRFQSAGLLAKGWTLQLPTEAQWEYACRAGTNTAFSFGNILNGTQANCDGKSPYGTAEAGPNLGRTVVVGSYRPNLWGLCDMHGNVWEWCRDRYEEYSKGSAANPEGPASGRARVFRGGSWAYSAAYARSARRNRYSPFFRDSNLGFRLAAVPPSSGPPGRQQAVEMRGDKGAPVAQKSPERALFPAPGAQGGSRPQFGEVTQIPPLKNPEPAGWILEKEGIVEVAEPNQPWRPAKVGENLPLQTKIANRGLGRAVVRLSNGRVIRINENSQLVLLPSVVAGKPLGIELQRGEIYIHTRGSPAEFALKTPTVTDIPHDTSTPIDVRTFLQPINILSEVEGVVTIIAEASQRIGKRGDSLEIGNRILTAAGARAVVILADGTVGRIGESSSVLIDATITRSSDEAPASKTPVLKKEKGTLTLDETKVKTPTVIGTPRG